MSPSAFSPSRTLDGAAWGPAVKRILSAALEAVEPGEAVRWHLRRDGDRLFIGEKTYDLAGVKRVFIVGAGKAGAPMAEATAEILGDRLYAGMVIVKEGHLGEWRPDSRPGLPAQLDFMEAGHPIPDERGVLGAQRIRQLLPSVAADDLVITLISGGGSALLVSPVEGVNLSDLQALTNALLASGANIDEINTLRKHLERLKGGGLAQLCQPARVAALILSDVIGDPLDVIASGPTVPDPSTFEDAWRILERYDLVRHTPPGILAHLQRGREGREPETPKPGSGLFGRVQNLVIGSNRQAADAALRQAQQEGFNTLLLTTWLQGEARQAGRFLAAVLRQAASDGQPVGRPACIVAGGETTVTLAIGSDRGVGLGGRNLEIALGAAADLSGLKSAALVTLATDGGDGPTDAAGAVVTGETLERSRLAGLLPEEFLKRNDSYRFFQSLGDLLRTGPTRTNVNDLAFLFTFQD
jgi:hydroxypyruvate reductase